MINWLKNMYRKQKESDKLLETMFVDRKEPKEKILMERLRRQADDYQRRKKKK